MMASSGHSVAVVGGGIAGLVCAARLSQMGVPNVTVFDTGKNAVGGRCSSRDVVINGQLHTFDHSAQYFTVSDHRFANIVSFLHQKDAIKQWKGPVGHLRNDGKFRANAEPHQAFVGTDGMKSIPECLASLVTIKRPVWVGTVYWETAMKKWKVDKYGYFDYLVIAHNGKCADKLMSDAGVPKIHSLLRVRFGERLLPKDARMQLCSQWVLLVAFEKSLGLHYQGAHVEDKDISWIANNTAKLKKDKAQSRSSLECWTIFSTRSFGSANKVPQENVPPKKATEVTNKLLESFAKVTKVPKHKLEPCFSRVQLWGAAVPMNILENGDDCVFDGAHQVAVCGDWLVSPCIQGAAVSAMAVADKIKQHSTGKCVDTRLDPVFRPAEGQEIGAFPTHPNMMFKPKSSA